MTTEPTPTVTTSYLIRALPSDVLAVARAQAATGTANPSDDAHADWWRAVASRCAAVCGTP